MFASLSCSQSRPFFLMIRRPPRSTLFPSPPLFRSGLSSAPCRAGGRQRRGSREQPADPHGAAMTHRALAVEWKRIECLCDIALAARQGKELSPDHAKRLEGLQAQVMAVRAQGTWNALGGSGLSHLALDILACVA